MCQNAIPKAAFIYFFIFFAFGFAQIHPTGLV